MFWRSLIDIVFPPLCLNCGSDVSSGRIICGECFLRIKVNETLFCGRCGARMATGIKICHFDFPYFLGAVGSYKDVILRNLIWGLKFRSVKLAADPLSDLLYNYTNKINFPWKSFTVVPLPLSKRRERKRGFNQSELIAEKFAKKAELPFENKVLIRHRHSSPQSDLKKWESREENVQNCFSVVSPEKLAGKNVILVDDVTTSGSTLISATSALKEVGVRRLVALVIAKV